MIGDEYNLAYLGQAIRWIPRLVVAHLLTAVGICYGIAAWVWSNSGRWPRYGSPESWSSDPLAGSPVVYQLGLVIVVCALGIAPFSAIWSVVELVNALRKSKSDGVALSIAALILGVVLWVDPLGFLVSRLTNASRCVERWFRLRVTASRGVGLLVAIVLDWFPGSYRSLTEIERGEAAGVFGASIDLDKVKLAVKSLPVDVIEKLNGGRTFTTMYLINFASWDKIDVDTLIHELTHVWQGLQEGPVYMVEALEAQLIGKGYNYGYDDSADGRQFGTGGEDELVAAAGDLRHFNEEQQAQMIMHYHARKTAVPSRDLTAWQPYANVVFA
jgi:hypothetical protein